jgi:hypothetical protein
MAVGGEVPEFAPAFHGITGFLIPVHSDINADDY